MGPWSLRRAAASELTLPLGLFPPLTLAFFAEVIWSVYLTFPFSLIFSLKSSNPELLPLQSAKNLLKFLGSKPPRLYSSESAFSPSSPGNYEVGGIL